MFERIDRISIELTKYCNFKCSYCHQVHYDRLLEDFMLGDIIRFINGTSSINREILDITPSGGEVTCHEERLREFLKRTKSEIRSANKRFALLSNMSNTDLVLSLLRDGTINRERVGFSWDGKYNCDTRINKFDNDYFMKQVKKLGESEFSKDINIQHAITRQTIPYLHDNIQFLIDSGIRNINIYLINGEEYSGEDASEYNNQLKLISDLFISSYINDKDRLRLYTFNKCFRDNVLRREEIGAVTRCMKIGSALHITLDGGIYPCIYFGDHDMMKLGDIYSGLDPARMENFERDYLKKPGCLDGNDCKNRHCLSCPAANYRLRGGLNNRDTGHCNMYSVEDYWFRYILDKIGADITPLSLRTYWGRVNEPT